MQAVELIAMDRLQKLLNIARLKYHTFSHGGKAGTYHQPVFINLDPRGYALKIDDEYMRAHNIQLHRDMGGYGIIAPEFDKDGN